MREEPSSNSQASTNRNPAWMAGVVLIVIGVVFLLQNVSGFRFDNWWAIFILIPALSSFAMVWRIYQSNGRLTSAARGPLIGGLTTLTVALVFLLGLDWGKIWPVFLIIAGVGALLSALFTGEAER